jgi:hypothetical protein
MKPLPTPHLCLERSAFPDHAPRCFCTALDTVGSASREKMRQNKDARAATEDCIALMTNHGRSVSLRENKHIKIKHIKINIWEA